MSQDFQPGDLIGLFIASIFPRMVMMESTSNTHFAGKKLLTDDTFALVVSSFYRCGCQKRFGCHLVLTSDALGWTFGDTFTGQALERGLP